MCECPKCNVELEIGEMFDEDWCDDTCIGKCYGYCPKCKTEYWIDMIYKFSHYEIEEMKGEN